MGKVKTLRATTGETRKGQPTIRERLAALDERTSERLAVLDQRTSEILVQVKATNGRVNRHDEWVAQHSEETRANIAKLNSVALVVNKHERLVDRARGAWAAMVAVAAFIGAVVGLAASWFK